MVRESKSGQMALVTRDNGLMTRLMVMVSCTMLTETSMRVIGLMTKLMEGESTLTLMEQNIMVSGKMTSNTVMESRHGQMVPSLLALM